MRDMRLHLPLLVALMFAGCGVDPPEAPAPAPEEAPSSMPGSGAGPGADEDEPPSEPEPLFAGAARVNATPVIGVPLGGYGARMRPFPDFSSTPATLFHPSTGVKDPLYCRALVLARGEKKVALVSVDAVAVVGHFVTKLMDRARAKGATVQTDETIIFASHTHSGPGAMTHLRFFELAAMDLHYPDGEDAFAEACAIALSEAEASLAVAQIGTTAVSVPGASTNRRVGQSPYVDADTVDTELGVVRVDRPTGEPVAVLWTYAIHGTALGPDNLEFSADVMGVANTAIEGALPGVVALFANGAEGDAAPAGEMEVTGAKLGEAVLAARSNVKLRPTAELGVSSHVVTLGKATLKLDSSILGDFDLSVIPGALAGEVDLGPAWVEHEHRFSALRIDDEVFASVPGEAIYEIGQRIKGSGEQLGFARTWILGLANGYVGYVTSAKEFDAGGYEAMMTLFGRDTGDRVVSECTKAMTAVK